MTLYHGSNDSNIIEFDLSHCRTCLDLGVGIYLTTNQWQAEEWARNKKNGTVYVFDIDINQLSVIEYKGEDLNYVLYLCRINLEDVAQETIDYFEGADIITGQMLDGNVKRFEQIAEQFNNGDILYNEFMKWVKVFTNKNQLCFKTQRAIDLLNRSIVRKYQVD